MLSSRLSVSAVFIVASLVLPGRSWAQDCGPDNPCAKGYTCQSVETPCLALACPPDSPDCVNACEALQSHTCVPAACDGPEACADDMVCQKSETQRCTGLTTPVCAPNTRCEVTSAPDPVCETVTVGMCVPRWTVPCQAPEDCGEGFTCEVGEECTCSSSTGSAGSMGSIGAGSATSGEAGEVSTSWSNGSAASGGAAATTTVVLPSEPNCSCRTLDVKYCKVIERNCDTSTPCPSGWTCSSGDAVSTCVASPDGVSVCANEPTPSLCMPPHSSDGNSYTGGIALGEERATGTTASEPPKTASDTPSSDTGALPDASSNSTGPSAPAKDESATDATAANDSDGGCHITAAGSRGGAFTTLLAMVIGAGLALNRRRNR